MPEKWTGELVGVMHNHRITTQQLANAAGCSAAYASMILSGKRKPKDGRERLEAALEKLLKKED